MNLGISGRVAFISGSTRGIGRAIAEMFHAEGCKVCISSRSSQDVNEVVSKLGERATGFSGNFQDPQICADGIRHSIKIFGQLDILVCNLGGGRSVAPGHETLEEWRRVMDLNFFSTTSLVSAARNDLAKSKGVIICISSICGLATLGAPITYSTAKAALNTFVRNMAFPLGQDGIRINAIAPGNIVFPGSIWEKKLFEDEKAVKKMLANEVPLNTLGTPEDVASLATFLVSPRASFITGSVVVVDGGQLSF